MNELIANLREKFPVFIVGGDFAIERMYQGAGFEIVDDIAKAKLVQFTGGEDVDPSLYGAKKNPTTYSNLERDKYEMNIFVSLPKDVLKVGICRGAQFLCVMNGGILYQNVNNHAISGTHKAFIKGIPARVVEVTSTHHQMMIPRGRFEILMEADESTRKELHTSANRATGEPDCESVWWSGTNSFGFQGHPEYSSMECRQAFFDLLGEQMKKVSVLPQLLGRKGAVVFADGIQPAAALRFEDLRWNLAEGRLEVMNFDDEPMFVAEDNAEDNEDDDDNIDNDDDAIDEDDF